MKIIREILLLIILVSPMKLFSQTDIYLVDLQPVSGSIVEMAFNSVADYQNGVVDPQYIVCEFNVSNSNLIWDYSYEWDLYVYVNSNLNGVSVDIPADRLKIKVVNITSSQTSSIGYVPVDGNDILTTGEKCLARSIKNVGAQSDQVTNFRVTLSIECGTVDGYRVSGYPEGRYTTEMVLKAILYDR